MAIKISRFRMDLGNKPVRIGKISGADTMTDQTVAGLTMTFTAGAALAFGDVCYMGADGKMEKGNADVVATAFVFAMCADATIAEDADGNFLLVGFARNDAGWAWATLGQPLYLDATTAGTMNQTAPAGVNDVIQILGIAVTADISYFNPQLVQVEHV